MNQFRDDFNITLLNLANNLACVCPDTFFSKNIKDIRMAINNPNNADVYINHFILKVLKFKQKINDRDESFFLGENGDPEDLKKIYEELQKKDTSVMKRIFEFKSIWKTLNQVNKNIVIDHFIIMCDLADQYLLLKY